MKKVISICLSLLLFFPSCSADYSYSDPGSLQGEVDPAETELLQTEFVSAYYQSLGEDGLKRLLRSGPVACLHGKDGTLLYANTPTRMIFNYATDKSVWTLMEYDKLSGKFSYACHDVFCTHESCLFSQGNRISFSANHLFFAPQSGEGETYVSDLDGENARELAIPVDAVLLSDTDNGLYWVKTEDIDGKPRYSLWRYAYSSERSERLTEPANANYYASGDTVYLHDLETLALYRFSEDFGKTSAVVEDVAFLTNFGGELYDYDYDTGVLRKLEGNQMVDVATIPSALHYWVSAGYIYYCCEDRAQIESYREDDELYEYLSRDNPTCGNVYRVKESGGTPELVYHGAHDGKPDRIDYVFADGEVLYLQYRTYLDFSNAFSSERGSENLAIVDVTTGESVEIANGKTR